MNSLIIIGASGHGAVIADFAIQLGYNIIFWDDDLSRTMKHFIVEKRLLHVPENAHLFIGIGVNNIREKISLQYRTGKFVTLIHPNSIISGNVVIGIGSVVMAGACINNSSIIGDHCIVNTGAVVDHDCIIESYVHVSPNATLCGNVTIGKGSWVGAGSVIIQGVTVGKNVTIGAGTVVIRDIPDDSTVVGNPGRIIKKFTNINE
jgi:acetyltransferase EpsM